MGLLNLFNKSVPSTLTRLPCGSFTVDRQGCILVRTLPSGFPDELLAQVADSVVATFREAVDAQLPLHLLIINYPTLRITARELRGGAMVFLAPTASETGI
jgi:hypothetical protein